MKARPAIAAMFLCALSTLRALGADPIDRLYFGDAHSESAHQFDVGRSETIKGGLGAPARRLLARDPVDWQGGTMSFSVKIDPEKQNFVTVRFWGDDVSGNRLFLFVEGRQLGYRHLGDIDQLDFGTDEPVCNGRFYYVTTPLPLAITRGKTELKCEIRATGPIWGYGQTFEQYQKPMADPSRGIYSLYTHTDGYFVPPADEKQGVAAKPTVRTTPGEEVIDQLKARVNRTLDGLLASSKPINQMQAQLLARAYFVKWSAAYQNPKAVAQVIQSIDAMYVATVADPKLAYSDPATWNADWFGTGPSGQSLDLLRDEINPQLDEKMDDGSGNLIVRRAAYLQMLLACRDYHQTHRRQYTNQTMISDLYGLYYVNRGVAVCDASKALAEPDARRYLYESIALQPWLGGDTDHGPSMPLGGAYMQLTDKGLSKELGYVGNYGEVIDWVVAIYNATRPLPDQPGDPKIKAQLVKIARARGSFRYPAQDKDGNRAYRLETIIGWRDTHFPGNITYAQRPSWDGSPLEAVAATLDPMLVGYAQQMLADNQFFASVQETMQNTGFRTTAGLLGVPESYERVKEQPISLHRLPMGETNYVFTDEEDGVVALRHGDEILYVSLYWRARNAINNLARVHHITPGFERVAIVTQETEFEPSGMVYTRPDWTNFGFGNGGLKYPGEFHSAHAGEQLPIAKIPEGVAFKPGNESVYAGKGDFYTCRYGDYLIGMNMTTSKSFDLKTPKGLTSAPDLVSKRTLNFGDTPIKVGPRSTVILYLGK